MSDPNTFRITFAVTLDGGMATAKIIDGTDGLPGLVVNTPGPEVMVVPREAAPWRAISACCEETAHENVVHEAQRAMADDLIQYAHDGIGEDVAEELQAYLVEQGMFTTDEEE